ncbi:ADAM 17-like protease [Oscarella lobularis]|uniref:ADAM 17-like protease n=1 Tax=Oscarella lobularis TaxID=121494 RepID=UPI00331368D4
MLFRSSLLLTVLFPCLTGFETQIHSALRHFDTLRTDEIKKHQSLARKNEVSILGRNFSLHLSNGNNLLAPNFRAVVSDETGRSQVFEKINRKEFYIGEEEDGSSVSAHIDSEQLVTATILSHDDAYYIEPSHRHIAEPHDFHMIAYRRSDVVHNYGERHDNGRFFKLHHPATDRYYIENYRKRRKNRVQSAT